MLSSICPLGERARHQRWWLTTAAYLLGSAAGGAALGAACGALGSLVPAPWRLSGAGLGIAAAGLAVGFAVDQGWSPTRLPSWQRQVDEAWLTRYRGWVYGLGFGAQLGFGLVTIIPSATMHALVLVMGLIGDVRAAALVGLAFGLVRALPVLAVGRAHDAAALRTAFRRLARWSRPADLLARSSLGLGAAILLLAAVAS